MQEAGCRRQYLAHHGHQTALGHLQVDIPVSSCLQQTSLSSTYLSTGTAPAPVPQQKAAFLTVTWPARASRETLGRDI